MSEKNRDKRQRWRCHTVAVRLSPEESKLLDIAVKLSGLTKQDYVCNRCLERDIIVQGNPRVYKALKDQLGEILDELKRIANSGDLSPDLLETIDLVTVTMYGMKGECACEKRK